MNHHDLALSKWPVNCILSSILDKIEHSSSMTLLEILGSIAGFAIVLFGVWIYRKICKQSAVVGTSDAPD